MAAPFVQGRLRAAALTVTIRTECAHCGRALELGVDSDLNVDVRDAGAEPLVFVPEVDWRAFRGPNIIDAY